MGANTLVSRKKRERVRRLVKFACVVLAFVLIAVFAIFSR
jgi:hypothetical protein